MVGQVVEVHNAKVILRNEQMHLTSDKFGSISASETEVDDDMPETNFSDRKYKLIDSWINPSDSRSPSNNYVFIYSILFRVNFLNLARVRSRAISFCWWANLKAHSTLRYNACFSKKVCFQNLGNSFRMDMFLFDFPRKINAFHFSKPMSWCASASLPPVATILELFTHRGDHHGFCCWNE